MLHSTTCTAARQVHAACHTAQKLPVVTRHACHRLKMLVVLAIALYTRLPLHICMYAFTHNARKQSKSAGQNIRRITVGSEAAGQQPGGGVYASQGAKALHHTAVLCDGCLQCSNSTPALRGGSQQPPLFRRTARVILLPLHCSAPPRSP